MDIIKFLNRTPIKLAWLTASFIIIGILGAIPIYIVQHMFQTQTIKIIIVVSGLVWAIGTIIWIFFASKYVDLWKRLFKELREEKMHQARLQSPEYMRLWELYPSAMKRHEHHYMKRRPKLSYREIIEKALKVSDEEWASREEFHRQNRELRNSYNEHKPPTLRRKGSNNNQRL